MTFQKLSVNEAGIILRLETPKPGILDRMLGRHRQADLAALSETDQRIVFALADLQELQDRFPAERLTVTADAIHLSHGLVSRLGADAGTAIGLPPFTTMTFATDVASVVGMPDFRLKYRWLQNGREQFPKRTGAVLNLGPTSYRIPQMLLDAIDIAEARMDPADFEEHWERLARFREILEPGATPARADANARISMSDFLQDLQIRLADRLSISPTPDGSDFDIVPFSERKLDAMRRSEAPEGPVRERDAVIEGRELGSFQQRVRQRGPRPAYKTGDGTYVVIEPSARPVLDAMIRMQHAPAVERRAFILNPRRLINDAVERHLRDIGRLDGLTDDADIAQLIEAEAEPLFIETSEFSERVIGLTRWQRPELGMMADGRTTWLPEIFPPAVIEALTSRSRDELEEVRAAVETAMADGHDHIDLGEGVLLPASADTLATLIGQIRNLDEAGSDDGAPENGAGLGKDANGAPIVLATLDNFHEPRYRKQLTPRFSPQPESIPAAIRTPLKPHQRESLSWAISAWRSGLPGILNADEQGLGKTLQTIAFIAWLQAGLEVTPDTPHGPILIVAPTSLLKNWEAEVDRHVVRDGLGTLIRMYGDGVATRRRLGESGLDVQTGEAKLDFSLLTGQIEHGKGHRFWMLTTYTTLTNYQHSFGRLPFSAIVFDEIQALKNPASLRSAAAAAMKADFRIGLTGTPIENTTIDLWAIMEQLCAGWLGTLPDFRDRYGTPDSATMKELHERIFTSCDGLPRLALRRLKDDVARDLPTKTRLMHPRLMPEGQADIYREARTRLASGKAGAALKALHHIRGVSVHPDPGMAAGPEGFIDASARLSACIGVLDDIRTRGERALVFIEDRRMQFRFVELARRRYGLPTIDIINGSTSITRRQQIVDRFQQALTVDTGFNLLVLGPKSAGTGLTLTAATHVIHLSRWWNPAVEEQCNDRVHRIGQTRPVTIHVPMAIHGDYREHSFDCLLHSLMQRKRRLANAALWPLGDEEGDTEELYAGLSEQGTGGIGDPVTSAIRAMFTRDDLPEPAFNADGSVPFA